MPVEIFDDLIYRLTGLSNKGEPVPVRLKPSLVEELTGTTIGKNSRGLIISQTIYGMPKIAANYISIALTSTRRGSKLNHNVEF